MREIRRGDEDYPQAFKDLTRPPEPLFTIGDESILRMAPNRLVAIVGTRDATPYGVRVTASLAKAFVAAGIGVVSGLARGIDSAAHRAALEAGAAFLYSDASLDCSNRLHCLQFRSPVRNPEPEAHKTVRPTR